MALNDTIRRMERIQRLLSGQASDQMAILGADICADVANRVINKGETATGGKFSAYSQRKVPAFWYFGRSVNSGGESRIRAAAKKRIGVSYADFRRFNSRQAEFKNFSFTNQMWRGFGVLSVRFDGRAYEVTIGGKTKLSKDRIAWMSGQEKRSIIEPSKKEIEAAKRRFIKYVLNG